MDDRAIQVISDRPQGNEIYEAIRSARAKGEQCFIFFRHEWEKREKQIRSHVQSYTDPSLKQVHARKCDVKQIDMEEVRSFCDFYHIQGKNRLGVAGWGLYQGGELLGVLSLGRHPRQDGDLLLDRLCFRPDVRVKGGASRLFSRAVVWAMKNGIPKIVSFSDNRWSIGEVYSRMGFVLEKDMPPDYIYISDKGEYFSKQSQKKTNVNCPEGMTEKEWAESRGLKQVKDAGKKRWVYKLQRMPKRSNPLKARRRGYFQTKKGGIIYYQSSYELRAAWLLDEMPEVKSYTVQMTFMHHGQRRYTDFIVTWTDGTVSIIEVKPERRLEKFKEQIESNRWLAAREGWKFAIWTEKELGLSEYKIMAWADGVLAKTGPVDWTAERKRRATARMKKHYDKSIGSDKVEVYCDYCKVTHKPLRITYEDNIRRNGTYICEPLGGKIAGSRPKPHLRKENPYAAEGKKQCTGKESCGLIKLFKEFSPDSSRRDGLCSMCKECRTKKSKAAYRKKCEGQ